MAVQTQKLPAKVVEYEGWAYARHQQRRLDEFYEVAKRAGSTVSEMYGDSAVGATEYNCTCHVCFVRSLQREWPSLVVDRVQRKAPATKEQVIQDLVDGEAALGVSPPITFNVANFNWDLIKDLTITPE